MFLNMPQTTQNDLSPSFLTPEDVATILQVSRRTVVDKARAGMFPGAIRLGNRWRIPADAIHALQAHPTAPAVGHIQPRNAHARAARNTRKDTRP